MKRRRSSGKKGALPAWMVDKAALCLEKDGEHLKKMLAVGVKIGFGTPLEDIKVMAECSFVMKNGEVFKK